VVTISQFSRREIVERLGVADARIHVIPPGIDPLHAPAQNTAQARPYVLFVGSIFNRRHVPHLIRAFAPVARRHPQTSLEIVGDNRSYPHQDLPKIVDGEGLSRQVRWRPWVTDSELSSLYRGARAFAFLSEYEGLGLTPLEALAAGVPPLLLDTPVARESCGDAALYVSLSDIGRTSQSLEQLLFDGSTRDALLTAAPAMLRRYSWPEAARQTLAVLENAADPA
jgi:glycosyltransferase involved in cell wall biosynthesis